MIHCIVYLLSAICAPMSGGKFLCTVLTTQTAIDLNPTSLALQRMFLKMTRNERIILDSNSHELLMSKGSASVVDNDNIKHNSIDS